MAVCGGERGKLTLQSLLAGASVMLIQLIAHYLTLKS